MISKSVIEVGPTQESFSDEVSNSVVQFQEEKDLHENILPRNRLIVVFGAMALGLFISFVDQTAITVALPHISKDLNMGDSASWAGTSSLISTTVFMVLFGRFSDIFSRKYVLIGSILCLAFSDLACGFAQTAYQIYIFRGFSGIGSGGITSLTMVIVSDVVSLEKRGKYQGILGSFVGIGNAVGPVVASAFIEHASWRYFYYMMCPVACLAAFIVGLIIPYTSTNYSMREKLQKIDYLGFFLSSTAIIFLLIPISGGGSFFHWNDPLIIAFLIIGGVSLIAFLVVEKYAFLPMIPLKLFCMNHSLTLLLLQNFSFGMCYYSALYYYPLFLQLVRDMSALHSSLLLLCMVIPQSIVSVLSGQVISRTKRFMHVIWFGYIMWTVGVCLPLTWKPDGRIVYVGVALAVNGLGIGAVFQPTLVAAQSYSFKKDRATVIATRNVLRSFGGAVGLAVSANIFSSVYLKILKNGGDDFFTVGQINDLRARIFSSINLQEFSPQQIVFLRQTLFSSIRNIFFFWIGCMGICLVTTLSLKEGGLVPLDDQFSQER